MSALRYRGQAYARDMGTVARIAPDMAQEHEVSRLDSSRNRGGRPRKIVSARLVGQVAELRAQGRSIREAATLLGVKKNLIEDALVLPETRDAIVRRREQLRLRAMQEMTRLEPKLWDRLDGL